MNRQNKRNAIPKHIAMVHCAQIRKENQQQWWNPIHWQCSICMKRSHGHPTKMAMGSAPGFRGCPLVNQRVDAEIWPRE